MKEPTLQELKKLALPITVSVQMKLYDINEDGWAWVAPIEEQHSDKGVNVRLDRVSRIEPIRTMTDCCQQRALNPTQENPS